MKSTINCLFWTGLACLLAILAARSPVCAQPLEIYTRTDAPAGWFGSPAIDVGWTGHGKGTTTALTVPANGSLYFAFENTYVAENIKTLGVEFKTTPLGAARLDLNAGMIEGYQDDGTSNLATVVASAHASEHIGKIGVNATISPQPEWELIEITNSASTAKTIEVEAAVSTCAIRHRVICGNGVPDSQMEFSDHMFGAEGNLPNTTRVTAVEVFPRNVDIDLSIAPALEAPPQTGNWTPEFVFVDPGGGPRPHGGVRWTSDGPGLSAGEMHDLTFAMKSAADSSYDFFTFDEDFGQYFNILVDLRDAPWYEDLETHYPDVGCGGWRGWKGWDDDPAFDAPVTGGQAHDGDNSIQIGGDADLVREFSDVDHGRWSFTCWQYIPSDFVSGGSGQTWGSFFLLLNTYNDGGPYNWSSALQADSANGMMNVFHGVGNDTVSVPYDPDRWVKIQVIADLDDDWTQVYYDDQLITEYPWTGGVFGDGGGLPEIQSVDLFANGSTPVYYDDLALEELQLVDADIVDIAAIRGTILNGGILEVQQSDDQYLHTRAGIGGTIFDAQDLVLEIGAQARNSANTIDLSIESRVDLRTGVARISLKNWDTLEFESVDTYIVGMAEEIHTIQDVAGQNYVRDGDRRIEMRIQQTVLLPFVPVSFDSYFDLMRIQTR